MPDLTEAQKAFLTKHQISNSSVLDATGLKPTIYKTIMRELEKVAAFGVTPCKKHGHQLRNRSGHCIQCNPATLAFQARHAKTGYVYVAGSQKLRLIKIGFSGDVDKRMHSLNHLNYASTTDWVCLYWVNSEAAGKLEFESQQIVKPFLKPTSYARDGHIVKCLETFSCNAKQAINAVETLASEESRSWKDTTKIPEYEFQPRIEETKSKKIKPSVIKKKRKQPKPSTQIPRNLKPNPKAPVTPSSPKVPITPSSPVVSFQESNTPEALPPEPLSKENSIKSNKKIFSPIEKTFLWFFCVLLPIGSFIPHISRLSSESNLHLPNEAPSQGITGITLEHPIGKDPNFKETSIYKPKEQITKDIEPPKSLSSSNTYTTLSDFGDSQVRPINTNSNSVVGSNTDTVATEDDLEKYIGKNRLAIRSNEGAPTSVTDTGTYILWHYPNFIVYINKTNNFVVKIIKK